MSTTGQIPIYLNIKETWNQFTANEEFAQILLVFISLIIIGFAVYFNFFKESSEKSDCERMTNKYSTINPKITSISSSFNDPIRNYYIMSAFNACSGGDYKNGYVALCNLKAILKQGVRLLDFEIYNESGEPVVATSSNPDVKSKTSYFVKETFNSIPFSEVMQTINLYAFSDNAPNKADPIFIHLRVQSNDKTIYDKLGNIFEKYNSIMVSTSSSYNDYNENFGLTPLKELRNKIVLLVDGSNNTYKESEKFMEYVNMITNSSFCWLLNYNGVKNNPDIDDLTDNNKYNMTLVLPNIGDEPDNPSAALAREYGCQMIAMCYQSFDTYLDENNKFFEKAGYAFVKKPEKLLLQEKDETIKKPPAQNPEYSYATRSVNTNLYSFQY
jgi:hypothetical protein